MIIYLSAIRKNTEPLVSSGAGDPRQLLRPANTLLKGRALFAGEIERLREELGDSGRHDRQHV